MNERSGAGATEAVAGFDLKVVDKCETSTEVPCHVAFAAVDAVCVLVFGNHIGERGTGEDEGRNHAAYDGKTKTPLEVDGHGEVVTFECLLLALIVGEGACAVDVEK